MVDASVIYEYFPDLSVDQKKKIEALFPLYNEWNEKINVISRKDIDELYIRHVLHALSLAKFANFTHCRTVLDVGTGGGFPGIPLAILFPEIQFHLVDSIGKKIRVVQDIASNLGLANVKAEQYRAEQIRDKYDMVTCRAVTQLSDFFGWIQKNLKPDSEVACLKGGELQEELAAFRQQYRNMQIQVHDIHDVIPLPFFETKKVIILKRKTA